MRQRLDQHLVARGLTQTRARARDLILRGHVRVDGKVVTKAAQLVDDTRQLDVSKNADAYVARSAQKLKAALDHFALPVTGRVALDIGASTGGFTQVLLEFGARHVYAVDVGSNQLHPDLKIDPRVSDLGATDARALTTDHIALPVTAITADVSFISLYKALPRALRLAQPGCWIIALIKPQFELGPDAIGKGGIVKSQQDRDQAVTGVCDYLQGAGWSLEGTIPSPLPGKRGNLEYLIAAHLNGAKAKGFTSRNDKPN